jgi:hypothetical protein
VSAGEKLRLAITNEGDATYAVRDEAQQLELLSIPAGESVEADYTAPDVVGAHAIQCSREGGPETDIELVVAGESETPVPGGPGKDTPSPDDVLAVAVSLMDFTVTPSQTEMRPGRINLIATNVSQGQTHELNVLQLQSDGSLTVLGGIPPIAPQEGGALLIELDAGTYRLACQIQPGEFTSTIDHYQQGMWVDITVE